MIPTLDAKDSLYPRFHDERLDEEKSLRNNSIFLMEDEGIYRQKVNELAMQALNSDLREDLGGELRRLKTVIRLINPEEQMGRYQAALFCCASINSYLGNFHKAIHDWDKLLKVKPSRSLKLWVRLGIGRTLLRDNKLDDALLSFQKGKRIKLTHTSRANCCLDRAIDFLVKEKGVELWDMRRRSRTISSDIEP